MERIFRLIGKIDDELVEKLILLDRLIMFYSRFLRYWETGKVYSNGKTIMVKFERTNLNGYNGFTERVFPVEDIDKRIVSYKKKVSREFIKRNENPRIQRGKEIHKWKLYIQKSKIKNAEIQM